jgi:hypothetical protein
MIEVGFPPDIACWKLVIVAGLSKDAGFPELVTNDAGFPLVVMTVAGLPSAVMIVAGLPEIVCTTLPPEIHSK